MSDPKQFWCKHVGGLGPPFPHCEICAKEAEIQMLKEHKVTLLDMIDGKDRLISELFDELKSQTQK